MSAARFGSGRNGSGVGGWSTMWIGGGMSISRAERGGAASGSSSRWKSKSSRGGGSMGEAQVWQVAQVSRLRRREKALSSLCVEGKAAPPTPQPILPPDLPPAAPPAPPSAAAHAPTPTTPATAPETHATPPLVLVRRDAEVASSSSCSEDEGGSIKACTLVGIPFLPFVS